MFKTFVSVAMLAFLAACAPGKGCHHCQHHCESCCKQDCKSCCDKDGAGTKPCPHNAD